ncbi:MAG: Lrp/AsnC family transcriptional regulator [Melioribacteraceae bacterium]|nr:Lrp/AsnC family transcriptional regulator [Melioribacteraceae bacterium]MCO6474297.1 Lrp/AsnC family transcriptional regulator [Melioribacteraceae bacterium]MDD3557222.1 Lrp/AsnC family transcriptional regulator [Melioribacteraceae bacterium]
MIDKIDIHILNLLQENGRIKRNAIAEAVGLSLPSLSERMRKLEESGIIKGYYTKVDRKVFGFDIMAIIQVITNSSSNYKKLVTNVKNTPEIVECYSVLGEGSHILKAIVKDTAALEKLLGEIQSWPGVNRTVTSFVLSAIKESTKLNLSEGK